MFADVFQEFVAFLAVFLVVGFVVEFDGSDGGQVVGFADDEVFGCQQVAFRVLAHKPFDHIHHDQVPLNLSGSDVGFFEQRATSREQRLLKAASILDPFQ